MKRLLTPALICSICLFGLNLTGCGGGGENTTVEATENASITDTPDMEAQYAEEMKKSMSGQ